ncbi:MAG TPA: GH92 family glycosyl hydrolase [Kofleriaceae bacterium]|jgi:putative alpha-1,2-mannosidase
MKRLALVCLAACGGSSAAPDAVHDGELFEDPPPPDAIVTTVGDPTPYVDPRIGTGGLGYAYGSCFVGAAVPHGLAKPAPDTEDASDDAPSFQHFSGYWAPDTKIIDFTQVHLHGTGATDYGVLALMPAAAWNPDATSIADYAATFTKANELAAAGEYKVTLDNGIGIAVAATTHAAVYRVTSAHAIVFDLKKALSGGSVDDWAIDVDDAGGTATGHLHTIGGMSGGFGGYTVYFAIQGSWAAHHDWANGTALDIADDATLAIGVSLVSLEGAQANLATEVTTLDEPATAASARAEWKQKLAITLSGGTDTQRRIFYTSLYHSFLMPSIISDDDGTYRLAGQPVSTASWHQMSDLSLWDTYRTVSPLYALVAPDSASDTARSLIAFDAGLGAYPKWPLAIGETGTMLGASAEVVIADAVARGVSADGALAYPTLRAAAMDPSAPPASRGGRDQVVAYMQDGYVPRSVDRSVSLTTEYANDDFALAQLAAAVGATDDHDALMTRRLGWRQLFDPAVGFLRARNVDGSFPTDAFNPIAQTSDYAEANAWQSLWMAANHDPDGLVTLFGTSDAAVAKLSSMFAMSKDDWTDTGADGNSLPRPYYWAGNEPDLNAAFVFSQLGHPELTAQWAGWIEDTFYGDGVDGIVGNDDGGAMGSWYVLATLGLYPIAGSDGWILGAPRFPRAEITANGHTLAIVADGDGPYVQSVTLDGAAVTTPSLTHAELVGASELRFTMGPTPSSWGH